MVRPNILRTVCFTMAATFFASGIQITAAQQAPQAQMAKENERRAVIQTSRAKVYTDAAEPPAQCAGIGVGSGTALALDVAYAAAQATGRPLFSSLIPYDASDQPRDSMPVVLSTVSDVKIGDLDVPAGLYSLYLTPSGNGWQLIVNRQIISRDGKYDSSGELGHVDLTEATPPATPEDKFRICLVGVSPSPQLAQEIHLLWGDKDFYAVITIPAGQK